MKRLSYLVVVSGFSLFTLVSCSDQASTNNGAAETSTGTDTNSVNPQRNSTDTINYLTKDTARQSQDVVDPDPPGGN